MGIARYPPAPAPAYAYNAGPSSSNWQRTDSASSVYARAAPTLADWKASPMWKPIKAITNMESLPDISATENSHVRRDKKVTFSMPADVCEMLQRTKWVVSSATDNPAYKSEPILLSHLRILFACSALRQTTTDLLTNGYHPPILISQTGQYPSNTPQHRIYEWTIWWYHSRKGV